MKLDGKQSGVLRDLICESFELGDFRMFVVEQLDRRVEDSADITQPMPVMVFRFIDALNREERTIDLIRALREARPTKKAVVDFCEPLLGPSSSIIEPRTAVRAVIQKLLKQVEDEQRQKQFQFLNAYKELHEILHQLQSFQVHITKAAADRQASGAAIPKDVALALTEWQHNVERYAAETEFPSPAEWSPWIAKFNAAVADLLGNDPAKAARSSERLACLPSRAQGELNAELVKCARRLRTNELVQCLASIVSAVGPGVTDSDLAEIRSGASRFQGLCMELAELTRRHDLCQKIGDALQEAVGLPEVTAARLTAWSEIEDWFTELVRGAPTDFRISRTHGAAETFSAIADPAKAKPAFDLFLQRFEDLFVNTDAALLKITNKLHYSAMTLNDLLRKV